MNQEEKKVSKKVINQEKSPPRRTVGQEALDIFVKGDKENSPIELQREMTREYYQNLIDCALDNRRKLTGSFYIVVITKNERLLKNVFRNYFFARKTCPTPDYDQSVFKYNAKSEEIEYIWTVPSQDACIYFMNNFREIPPEEQQLLDFIVAFKTGKLMQKAKKLNGEREKDSFIESEVIS